MKNKDEQQDYRIEKHGNRIITLEAQQEEIYSQVKNHLPSQIKELGNRVCDIKKSFNEYKLLQVKEFSDFKSSNGKWQAGILVSIILLLLATLINLIK